MDSMFKYVLFDLDETLYPTSTGLMHLISDRMREYIIRKYDLPPDQARALQKRYWVEYGTTLRGLYIERKIDPDEYLKFVHEVPVTDFVGPDARLRSTLESIPNEKVILTNSDVPHTRRVLEALGVSDLFTRVFDVVCFEYECKPAPRVYERALELLPARGEECVLIDDMARNMPPARRVGIKTILLGHEGEADEHIESIYEVGNAIARLEGSAA